MAHIKYEGSEKTMKVFFARRMYLVTTLLFTALVLVAGASFVTVQQINAHAATPAAKQISSDPFTNTTSQHQTEVEPSTFAYGSTIVSLFQSGRFAVGGGASDIL